VPGADVDAQGNFKRFTARAKYLFPVKALSKVLRAKYVCMLREKVIAEKPLIESLFEKDWVVYAKRPFGGPKQVIEYLGRYTPKIAIGNHRLQEVNNEQTVFAYKDYKTGGAKKQTALIHAEFIRRFAMHIPPLRFVRIRHYRIVSSTWKRKKFKELRQCLQLQEIKPVVKIMLHKCPCCKAGTMRTIEVFGKCGPPKEYLFAVPRSTC